MSAQIPTIHASAILIGARAILIRGPSGSGKSQLALRLLQSPLGPALPFVRLVGDDRVHIEPMHGRLLVRPAPALAGLLEIRGLSVAQLPFEPSAVVGLVLDLAVQNVERLPAESDLEAVVAGIHLPRLAVAAGADPLPLLLGWLWKAGFAVTQPGKAPAKTAEI